MRNVPANIQTVFCRIDESFSALNKGKIYKDFTSFAEDFNEEETKE
jgi:hypothetical protein